MYNLSVSIYQLLVACLALNSTTVILLLKMYRLEEKKVLVIFGQYLAMLTIVLLFEEMYVLWKETKTKDLVCFTICLHLQGLHDNET